MVDDIEARVTKKLTRRLIPFLTACFFIACLDRVNISFAAPTMSKDLGLSAYTYGWAAGIFFLTYTLLDVPSNLLLIKYGARRWIARIMITWGLLSACMAFVTGPMSLISLRFLLGVAEAGFFPGIIFYLAHWFPSAYRGRVTAIFVLAVPVSNGIGALVSVPFLQMHGILGLAGWQWLFIAESLPAVVLGFVVYKYLNDRPSEATWLTADERTWLENKLASETSADQHHNNTLLRAVKDPRVLILGFVWLLRSLCLYGVTFFLPQVVGVYDNPVTAAVAIGTPSVIGAIMMVAWARHSDRYNERRWHLVSTFVAMTIGLLGAGAVRDPSSILVCLTVAAIGYSAVAPILWVIPSTFLSNAGAAGGIALINAIGYIGGLIGPVTLGWVKDNGGSYHTGFYLLAGVAAIGLLATVFGLRGLDGGGSRMRIHPIPEPDKA